MVRLGVIGTNWITERLLSDAKDVKGFSLSAVYSRTEEKGSAFAEKYGVENVFTDIESMVQGDHVDAVYIASPNSLHCEQAIICMEHGKHVLCEKPIASNEKEFKRMKEVATRNRVLLMEAVKTTFLPNFQVIRENLHKIGKVRKYVASYCQYSSRYDAYKDGTVLNAFRPEFSNGAVMDIGIYCVYPAVYLFGAPQRVQAMGVKLESGVDGQGTISLQYEDMEATVVYSKISNSYLPSEIQGELGSILIDKIHTPEKVEIRYNDGGYEDHTVAQDSGSMRYEMEEFVSLINEGKIESDINSYETSRITSKIIEEARRQLGVVFPADE
ncbi:Gfo/Idh/MocA family protein [Evansella sp. AB-rgal1]|uniref:Gfo/Idh/MocA family protein n=1 Tax=Evansella sp. AB-rgal1 TaxID=3242696 RepID=UPI00359CCC60